MSVNKCMVCGTQTRKRVTVTAPGHSEVLDVAACDLHTNQVRRQLKQNLNANGIEPVMRGGRFNPKKNRQDRRRVMRRMDIQDIIPRGRDTAMRSSDEGVINK